MGKGSTVVRSLYRKHCPYSWNGEPVQTSLQGIAEKAKRQPGYRFLNLYTMLNYENLLDSWRYLKKDAACGVDRISAREYEKNLEGNIRSLVERLKRKGYRAKLVRRQYIPKGKGKYRPLGIPAIEDKLLQKAVSRILETIYEQEFLVYSFGYRPNLGAQDAVGELTYELQFGWFGYVVDADITSFFDNLDHDWLIKMLSLRIRDDAFLRLIRKWLKAGILDTDGQVIHPATGTPQGGIVSPVLANIYLHYVLDLWYEKVVKPRSGNTYFCRYADDFVCLFRYQEEAERFYRELPKRLGKFGLSISQEKTRIVRFTKHRMQDKSRFDFLGFEFRWAKNRSGKPQVKRRTSRKKFRQALRNFTEWCRHSRNLPLRLLFSTLNSKLHGYYNYYGIIDNSKSMWSFYYNLVRVLFKWLNRRSQRRSYNWQGFNVMLKHYKLERPRITERRRRQLKSQLAYS
jgi:RNA-directed DNA polymerase